MVGRRDTVGLGQPGPLVERSELDVVASLRQHLGDGVGVECAGVREAGAAVADDTDADPRRLGTDEVLDFALVDPNLGVAATRHERLELLSGFGLGDDAVDDRQQVGTGVCLDIEAHAAVPPIVSDFTRKVG